MAVIGCGGMESTHEEGFAALGSRIEIVATVDPIISRAESAAESLGARLAVRSHHEIMDLVDAALVVTPHHTHRPIGLDLIRAGKHVLMEKPLANSERECWDLIEAAVEENVQLMVAYPMRYHPLVLAMKAEMDAGLIGEVFQVAIWTEQLTRFPDGHWGNSISTLGGGQFFSHGCHYVDLLMWLLGNPVKGSHMGTRVGTPWLEGEGSSNIQMKFESGAVGYHFGSWGARGTKNGYEIHVHGDEGMLALDFEGSSLKLYQGNVVKQIAEHRGSSKYVQGELQHFLDCVEGRADPVTDARSSLHGLRVIWQLYEAERLGVVADLSSLAVAHGETGASALNPGPVSSNSSIVTPSTIRLSTLSNHSS